MNRLTTNILIVGGGPAGLAAALSASEDSKGFVTVIDDNPILGGQIWKASLGEIKSPYARKLIEAITKGKVNIVNHAQVFGSSNDKTLLAETPDGPLELEFKNLIIATGARELFIPFPGWTLPNVCGAGGLQALVKGGLNVENKRIVVAGTGALLLAVAEFLKANGAKIVAVAEQAPSATINRFAFSLWRSPSKLAQAIDVRRKLIGIPYLTDCWVTAANGSDRLRSVELIRHQRNWTVECDLLACGYHLVPNTELAKILCCKIDAGFVNVDEYQRTSIENIFCAGEPTGIGGVEASLIEGKIAGYAASGDFEKACKLFRRRDKSHKFADALNKTFALRDELRSLPDADTIVCRCEDVAYGTLTEFSGSRDAKLQTRCGMGPCQARICGPATEFLFGWKPGSVRPPIFPVKMENL